MKGTEKFLFFYSIVAITVIFFTSAIFNRTPQNIISGVALIPLIFYFWLRLTSASTTTISRWSVRFLTIIIVLSGLGIFTYFLSTGGVIKTTSTESEVATKLAEITQNLGALYSNQSGSEQLAQELAKIQAELDELKNQNPSTTTDSSLSEVLLEADKNYLGQITLKSTIKAGVDVYESMSFSSSKVGIMEPNINYYFLEKTTGWYKIVINQQIQGWINETYVMEVK